MASLLEQDSVEFKKEEEEELNHMEEKEEVNNTEEKEVDLSPNSHAQNQLSVIGSFLRMASPLEQDSAEFKKEEEEEVDYTNEADMNLTEEKEVDLSLNSYVYQNHPLQNKWVMWYFKPNKSRKRADNLTPFISFDTIEEFWWICNIIYPPSDIPPGYDYMLFKEGIQPMWEDENNKNGGRWMFRLRKKESIEQILDIVWMETLLCIIGQVFDDSSYDVCGAVVQKRSTCAKISIWTRNVRNKTHVLRIGRAYKERIKYHMRRRFKMIYQSHLNVAARSPRIKHSL